MSKNTQKEESAGQTKIYLKKYYELLDKLPDDDDWVALSHDTSSADLPKMIALDMFRGGFTMYAVKNAEGIRDVMPVADHNTWKYRALDAGVTHFYKKPLRPEDPPQTKEG